MNCKNCQSLLVPEPVSGKPWTHFDGSTFCQGTTGTRAEPPHDWMTNERFLSYMETHCRTARKMFSSVQATRLDLLAGAPHRDYTEWVSLDEHHVDPLVCAARRNLGLDEPEGLSTPEPPPVVNTNPPIQELVIADMRERMEVGLQRYGTYLQANNGRDALVDLYQELLDAVQYCRQEMEERFLIINKIVGWLANTGIQMPERLTKARSAQLGAVLSDIHLAIRDLQSIKNERDILLRERKGEVWFWSTGRVEDGDNINTITCPVLIDAGSLRAYINHGDTQFAIAQDKAVRIDEQAKQLADLQAYVGFLELKVARMLLVCQLLHQMDWCIGYSIAETDQPILDQATSLAEVVLSTEKPMPLPMILFCPACQVLHIDREEHEEAFAVRVQKFVKSSQPGEPIPERWTNPPHKSHKCENCGVIWRPADIDTVGVHPSQISRGKNDTWER